MSKKSNYLTIAEVAEELRVSETTLRRMVKNNQIGSTRVGSSRGRIRFEQSDIEAYMAAGRTPVVHPKPVSRKLVVTPKRDYGF